MAAFIPKMLEDSGLGCTDSFLSLLTATTTIGDRYPNEKAARGGYFFLSTVRTGTKHHRGISYLPDNGKLPVYAAIFTFLQTD